MKKKHQKSQKTVKTDVDKNLQRTPIIDIRDVVPDTDSCPESSELFEPQINYSNTVNQKSEKRKVVLKFENKMFPKNDKFSSEKLFHSENEPCPMLFGQKISRCNKSMFYKIMPKQQSYQKTGPK